MSRDLSIIIPARNEMFLQQTVSNILENIEADTEIIAILDGWWPNPPMPNHPRVTIVHHTDPIGQRAATNEGARLSQAKVIGKVDAHCAFGKGFDRIILEDIQPDWTMVPMMYRFRAFDWVCKTCGNRMYQGTIPEVCGKQAVGKRSWDKKPGCGGTDFEMDVLWQRRENKFSVSWRFNNELQFKYWKKHCKRPEVIAQGDLIESMSFIGACFFIGRDRYWDIDGFDEGHGSWGQYGTELACKSWLSGGKLVTTKKTWFGHMFRTGNFRGAYEGSTFPYRLSDQAVQRARKYSQDLWMNNRWPKAIHDLSWLVEKFKPVPDFHDKDSRLLVALGGVK